jgi:L-fuculose-phosphate aldolase
MFMDENKLRLDIVEIGKRMYAKNFVASNDGNISIKISDNALLITPSGVSKGYMSPEDMLKVDMEGNVLEGSLKPSSEIKMHLEVYKKRADVFAVVHAHPQKATAFAVAHKCFDKVTLPEIIFSLGKVCLAEYGTPSTYEIPKAVGKYIQESDALLLANHGALTVGKDVYDAYYKMETVEHFAAISLYARQLGGEVALDEDEIKKLLEIKSKMYGK